MNAELMKWELGLLLAFRQALRIARAENSEADNDRIELLRKYLDETK